MRNAFGVPWAIHCLKSGPFESKGEHDFRWTFASKIEGLSPQNLHFGSPSRALAKRIGNQRPACHSQMRTPTNHMIAVTIAMLAASGCGPKDGDAVGGLVDIPSDSTVILRIESPQQVLVELPESLRSRFVQMVHQEATYVDFSSSPMAPIGQFEIGELIFYWHGNSVVHGHRRKGLVWTSPFMQALVNQEPPFLGSEEDWKGLLDGLSRTTDIDATAVRGLLRY